MQELLKIRHDEHHGLVLQKSGKDTFCPFQAPLTVPMQTGMGGVNLTVMRMPCSTTCPFSSFDTETNTYYTRCQNSVKEFKVESVEEQKPKGILKSI